MHANRIVHRSNTIGVQPGQRLIEHDDPWLVQVTAADRHFLAHATRQIGTEGVTLFSQLKLGQQGFRTRRPVFQPIGAGDKAEMLPHRELIEESRFIGHVGESGFGGDRFVGKIMTADNQAPTRRCQNAEKFFEMNLEREKPSEMRYTKSCNTTT